MAVLKRFFAKAAPLLALLASSAACLPGLRWLLIAVPPLVLLSALGQPAFRRREALGACFFAALCCLPFRMFAVWRFASLFCEGALRRALLVPVLLFLLTELLTLPYAAAARLLRRQQKPFFFFVRK